CGLRPLRAARSVRSTESQPGMVSFSPLATTSEKAAKTPSRTSETCFWVSPEFSATSATSSLRFLAIKVSSLGQVGRSSVRFFAEELPLNYQKDLVILVNSP